MSEFNDHPALAGIRDDGTVEGHYIETHYRPCKGIITAHDLGCVRVVIDDEGFDTETRILFETLIADGWMPPAEKVDAYQDRFETGAGNYSGPIDDEIAVLRAMLAEKGKK